jgi:hypothetical protein
MEVYDAVRKTKDLFLLEEFTVKFYKLSCIILIATLIMPSAYISNANFEDASKQYYLSAGLDNGDRELFKSMMQKQNKSKFDNVKEKIAVKRQTALDLDSTQTSLLSSKVVQSYEKEPKYIMVPDVIGYMTYQAEQEMKNAGIETETVYVFDDLHNFNTVINQSIPKGKKVEKGSQITLYVGTVDDYKGELIPVPDLLGIDVKKAKKLAGKLKLDITYEQNNLYYKKHPCLLLPYLQ